MRIIYDIRILHGGSVISDTTHDILRLANADAVLIGGARPLAAAFDVVRWSISNQPESKQALVSR